MMNAIDNFGVMQLLGSDSVIVDHVALVLTNAFVWIPIFISLLLLLIKNNDNMQQIFLCFGCAVLAVLIASIMANLVAKPLVQRPRPCNTDEVRYLVHFAGGIRNKDFSFFSSHSANTMALTMFFIMLVRSKLLSIAMLIWTFTTCWTRLYLGQHFFTDVMVGLAWGAVSGLLAYGVYRMASRSKRVRRGRFVSEQYTSTGYSKADIDIVMSVMTLTLLTALITAVI